MLQFFRQKQENRSISDTFPTFLPTLKFYSTILFIVLPDLFSFTLHIYPFNSFFVPTFTVFIAIEKSAKTEEKTKKNRLE